MDTLGVAVAAAIEERRTFLLRLLEEERARRSRTLEAERSLRMRCDGARSCIISANVENVSSARAC